MTDRWAPGYCLIEYNQLLDESLRRREELGPNPMWTLAVEQVRARDEELKPHTEDLDGSQLP